MATNEAAIEAEIQRKGLNAPRLTPDLIDATIVGAAYHVFPGTTLTVCALTLRNGFQVTGESAAASPANFDEELGRKIAFENARNKIWALEGYLLRTRLADESADQKVERIARVTHEVNRAYCASLGDTSQAGWEEAPDWQRDSARNGVRMHLANPDATPADSHASWLAQKDAEGWTYGPVKDPETKRHPCFVPYGALPAEQRAKDYLFRAVVHALR